MRNHHQAKIDTVIRWSAKQAIPVFIGTSSPHFTQAEIQLLGKLIVNALQKWEKAALGLITFKLTNQNHPEMIRLNLQKAPAKTSAQCIRTIDPNGVIGFADITICIGEGALSTRSDQATVLAMILHELGHALGLEHSGKQQDVMYHQGHHQSARIKLSLDDMCALLWNYRLPAGLGLNYIATQNHAPFPDTLYDLVPTLDRWYWNLAGGDYAMKKGLTKPPDISQLLYQQFLAGRKGALRGIVANELRHAHGRMNP